MASKAVVNSEVADGIKAQVAEVVTTYGAGGDIPGADLAVIHKAMRELAPRNPEEQVRGVAMIDRTFEQDIVDAQRAVDDATRELRRLKAHRSLFRDFIRDVMVGKDIPKLKTDLFTVSVVAGSEKLTVVDLDAVSEEFAKYKKTAKVAEAKAAFKKDGVVPTGFEFVRGNPSIRIRTR